MALLFYRFLYRVRPAGLASLLKKVFGVSRRVKESRRGLKYYVDPVSQLGFPLYKFGDYEPNLSSFVAEVLRPGDTFVDVGANEGYFSMIAGSKVGDGRVFAVEPQSRLHPVIEKNVELNGLKNVTIARCAFGDKAGELTLHMSSDVNNGSTGMTKYWRFGGKTETVPVVTFDEFCKTHKIDRIRFLKIDVEGAEGLVLSGALSWLKARKIDFIDVELHEFITGPEVPKKVVSILTEAGYKLHQLPSGMHVYLLPGLESQFVKKAA